VAGLALIVLFAGGGGEVGDGLILVAERKLGTAASRFNSPEEGDSTGTAFPARVVEPGAKAAPELLTRAAKATAIVVPNPTVGEP